MEGGERAKIPQHYSTCQASLTALWSLQCRSQNQRTPTWKKLPQPLVNPLGNFFFPNHRVLAVVTLLVFPQWKLSFKQSKGEGTHLTFVSTLHSESEMLAHIGRAKCHLMTTGCFTFYLVVPKKTLVILEMY